MDWTCRMNMDIEYGHGHAAWTYKYVNMQHRQDLAACPCSYPCFMAMPMLHVYVRAACPVHTASPCIQYAACPCQYCMTMSMLNVNTRAARPCPCCMSIEGGGGGANKKNKTRGNNLFKKKKIFKKKM
jgi:hypothetical protein